jgi:hypothetical protein
MATSECGLETSLYQPARFIAFSAQMMQYLQFTYRYRSRMSTTLRMHDRLQSVGTEGITGELDRRFVIG